MQWMLAAASYIFTYLIVTGTHPVFSFFLVLTVLWLTFRNSTVEPLPRFKIMKWSLVYTTPIASIPWRDLCLTPYLEPVTEPIPALLLLIFNVTTTAVVLCVNRKLKAAAGSSEPKDKMTLHKNRKQQLQNELGLVKAGLTGELLVAKELEKLPDSYYVLNDVPLSAEDLALQVDHVVVGPVVVLAVETKHISGVVHSFDEGILVSRGGTGSEVKTEGDPRRQARFNAKQLSERLGCRVTALVVLSHPQGAWQGPDEGCPVLHLSRLLHFILVELPRTVRDRESIELLARQVHSLALSFEKEAAAD